MQCGRCAANYRKSTGNCDFCADNNWGGPGRPWAKYTVPTPYDETCSRGAYEGTPLCDVSPSCINPTYDLIPPSVVVRLRLIPSTGVYLGLGFIIPVFQCKTY